LINYVTVGNCIPTENRYPYVARVASIQAGLSMQSVAMAVNRLCSSGLQGIVTSAQQIMLGDCDYANWRWCRSNVSWFIWRCQAMRTGARMGDTKMIDMMVSALTDPFGVGHMGITAENLAKKWGISREEQDAFAAESHRKAAAAQADGKFKSQIVPITLKTRKGEVIFESDEGVKAETTFRVSLKIKTSLFERKWYCNCW
jgi:acetyl-CoA C-acetyltransferase